MCTPPVPRGGVWDVEHVGFGVWGLGFVILGLGFWVLGFVGVLGFGVWGLGFADDTGLYYYQHDRHVSTPPEAVSAQERRALPG